MPLMQPGCTSLPPQKCAGGCGTVEGAGISDGEFWCSECGTFPPESTDNATGADMFEPVRWLTYHNGVRYYVQRIDCRQDGPHYVLLDSSERQLPPDRMKPFRHLLPR